MLQASRTNIFIVLLASLLMLILAQCPALCQQQISIPKINIGVDTARNPQDVSNSLQIIILLTILTLAPSILLMMTSFTRIVIVLSFLRSAMGTQQVPPNQVLMGLSLFLTFFTMAPVIGKVNDNAIKPYMAHQINYDEAISRASVPVREFMFRQTKDKDIALFVYLSRMKPPEKEDDIPTSVLMPAFIISELKTAFTIGFIIYLPFLIIDMVISVTLMSMGMMMLPPVMISLPFKLLLFVMVDGWHLISKALVMSFH